MDRRNILKSNLNKSKTQLAFTLFLISFTAQAQSMPQASLEVDVQSCHYLNTVEASSGYGKNTNWQVLAKYYALDKANNLGASHLVWEKFVPVGAFNGIAVGKAYLCKS